MRLVRTPLVPKRFFPPFVQACPYTFMLWFVPMHLLTHELLLFATGIWTNNIHDNIDGKVR